MHLTKEAHDLGGSPAGFKLSKRSSGRLVFGSAVETRVIRPYLARNGECLLDINRFKIVFLVPSAKIR